MIHAYASFEDMPGRLMTCGQRCRLIRFVDPSNGRLSRTWLHDPDDHDGTCRQCLHPREWRIDLGRLVIDLRELRVTVDGREIHLTPSEWKILEVLARQPGTLVRQAQLLAAIHPGPVRLGEPDAHLLRVHMSRLRAKLGEPRQPNGRNIGRHGRWIQTVTGHGYLLREGL